MCIPETNLSVRNKLECTNAQFSFHKCVLMCLLTGEMIAHRLDEAMAKYHASNQEGKCVSEFCVVCVLPPF